MFGRVLGLFIAAASFLIAVRIREARFPGAGREAEYYTTALILGSVGIAVVIGASLLRRKRAPAAKVPVPPTDADNRRETYRIPYPEDERPVLQVNRLNGGETDPQEFPVLDLSEEGIRIRDDGLVDAEDVLEGRLLFGSGRQASISGRVVRREGAAASLHLGRVVPPSIIVEEQLRLREQLRRR